MQPPPEKPGAVYQRRYVITSFWAVILLLGVPTWWKTTSIPRAALPIQEMLRWESEQPSYKIPVTITAPKLSCEDARQVATDIQFALDQRNEFEGFRLQTQLVHLRSKSNGHEKVEGNKCNLPEAQIGSQSSALNVVLEEGRSFLFDISTENNLARLEYNTGDLARLPHELAEILRSLFVEEQAAVAYQYYTRGFITDAISDFVHHLPQETVVAVQRNAARSLKPSPEYHLTFSLFAAGGTPSSWDVETVTKHYIQPLAYTLSETVNISVTTQIQLYSTFSPSIQPYELDDEEGWFLREQNLTAFINTAEWPLSPSIGSGPTINFILYVPAKTQLPLRIEGNKGGSWIVPQWGGITIVNPPLVQNPETHGFKIVSHLDQLLLQPAFETFRTQLFSLLGVPTTSRLPLSLRLRSFQRLSGLSLYLRSASNLSSLARLAQRLSNIPIPHHVLDLVNNADQGLRAYRENGAMKAARTAYSASEKAFFDKSMVGQVYFPDEHKVAVYLPLLGPIGVPLVVALLRELKQLAAKR